MMEINKTHFILTGHIKLRDVAKLPSVVMLSYTVQYALKR
jgi:hypothetical protein